MSMGTYTAANPASSKSLQQRLTQAASGLKVDFLVTLAPVMTTTVELAAENSNNENSTSNAPATKFMVSLTKTEVLTEIFAGMAACGDVSLSNVEADQEIVYGTWHTAYGAYGIRYTAHMALSTAYGIWLRIRGIPHTTYGLYGL
jgi:hypothetical protein